MKAKTRKSKSEKKIQEDLLAALDSDLSLFNATDLFWSDFSYHNQDLMFAFTQFDTGPNRDVTSAIRPVSRFEAMRELESSYYQSRPFAGKSGIAITQPDVNMGYLQYFMTYLKLPYESVFMERDFTRVNMNRTLYENTKYTKTKQEQLNVERGGPENKPLNMQISLDFSSAFNKLLTTSKKYQSIHEELPRNLNLHGVQPIVHDHMTWTATPVHPLDFVTEPQCKWDSDNWTRFFVIKSMTVSEALNIMANPDEYPHWDTKALRWALQSSLASRNLLSRNNYISAAAISDQKQGENFTVRSFNNDKSLRMNNIYSYYGRFFVVEGYIRKTDGSVTKIVFFPSTTCRGVTPEDILHANQPKKKEDSEKVKQLRKDIDEGANILFKCDDAYTSIRQATTVIPYDRTEPSLERQRGPGHLLYSVCDAITKLDCGLMQASGHMTHIFYRNRNQGVTAEDAQDPEIGKFGGSIDISSVDIEQNPFESNLQSISALRQTFVNLGQSLCFLGGLDNTEKMGQGRGAELASLLLVRDGRVHKHRVEFLASGLKDLYSKSFRSVLDICNDETDLKADPLVNYIFYQQLTKVDGYKKEFFEYKEDELIEDTYLPYWLTLYPIRNGASQFGAVEIALYEAVFNIFSPGLSQRAIQNMSRLGIRSILGTEQANDILGTEIENQGADEEQRYWALSETAAILGGVSTDAQNFVPIPIRPQIDDNYFHNKEVHNPKAQEIIDSLKDVDFSPKSLEQLNSDELSSRNDLILKLAALCAHISLHNDELAKFKAKRADIGVLREETNNILQTSESLLKNMQLVSRALLAAKQEEQARLNNVSPENVAEQEKQKTKQAEINRDIERIRVDLQKVDMIEKTKIKVHNDKQLTAARDRQSREWQASLQAQTKQNDTRQVVSGSKKKTQGSGDSLQ